MCRPHVALVLVIGPNDGNGGHVSAVNQPGVVVCCPAHGSLKLTEVKLNHVTMDGCIQREVS